MTRLPDPGAIGPAERMRALMVCGMGAVIVALAIGGPIGRLKGNVGPIEIDAEGD